MQEDVRNDILNLLLDHVDADRYPSGTMMNIIEKYVDDEELAEEYASILADKIADDRFPSMDMVRRAMRYLS